MEKKLSIGRRAKRVGLREEVGGAAEKLGHSVLGCRPCALEVALAS